MAPTSQPVIPNARRRLFLRYTLVSAAAVAVAGAAGAELVSRGVLPGKSVLDAIDGACSVPAADLTSYAPPGPSLSGTFYSAARRRTVGYTIAYPPGHGPGDRLPLVIALHGFGGDHTDALSGMGISMGGYGALLLAEKHPGLIAAAAAISPAVWTGYPQARAANAGAYASAAAFAADDAVTHAAALARVPVRVAAGYADPFYSGVRALARALPRGAVVEFGNGCHDSAFFTAQEPPSLAFLARHLTVR